MRTLLVLFTTFILSVSAYNQSIYFPPLSGNAWDTISPQSLNWCQNKIDSLYHYLDTNNTKAFILLKDGKIVLEKYFGSHNQATLWQWASAGKTVTAFMVGIAQQENLLSIHDTTSVYLGQAWTQCTPGQEAKITIRHQLTMTTGLDDGVPDHYCTLDSCLVYKADAGTRWAYHNAPYTLLDQVIETATGQTLNAFTTQKLKNPTGMTGLFVPIGYNNVFFSNARSMARFGLLILNSGNWNGHQIMTDTNYFHEMISTSQSLNPSYGYLWWLNGKSGYMVPGSQFVFNGSLNQHAPADLIMALGKDGQFLNVVPGRNMVWVRMGNSPDGVPVPFLMNDKIWEYINHLECDPVGIREYVDKAEVRLFPNPGQDIITLEAGAGINKLELYSVEGQLLQVIHAQQSLMSLPISGLPGGLYFVKVDLSNGTTWTGKLVKE